VVVVVTAGVGVGLGAAGRAVGDCDAPARGLALTDPRGSSGPGLDGGADADDRLAVARAADVSTPTWAAFAVPCTGCWSSASTSPPMIQASSTTARTETPAANARRRQYTDCGNGPFGSIIARR
jgi:hypothetical protein